MKIYGYTIALVVACLSCPVQTFGANIWHAWGTHGGTVATTSPGVIDATVNDTDGDIPDYHWNKSSWASRTGQKAFVSTADFNGMTLENAITSLSYTVDVGNSTFWGNAYWNIILEEPDGDRAILAPSYNSPTSSGFATDGSAGALKDFAIFEAEAGWTSTGTGFNAAEWSEVKNLDISAGPFTEFPDTLGGTATMQGDAAYTIANWAAWADQSAGSDAGWESDGVLFVFGQSTGTNPGRVVIENVSVNGMPVVVVPEPASFALGGLGLALMLIGYGARRQRRHRGRVSNLTWSTALAVGLSIVFASSGTSTAGTLNLDNLDWNVQILIDQSQTVFGQSQFSSPRDNRGLAASPNGQFLYAGYNNSSPGQVRRIDLSQTGMVDPFDNQLTGKRGKAITVDDQGRVYLAEGSSSDFIHVYSADLSTALGTIDLGATSKSEGVAVVRESGDLMLYTSDRTGGTLEKRMLTESGSNITAAALVGGFGTGGTLTLAASQDMRGVEIDGSGRVWVAGFGNDTLYRVSADGSTVDTVAVSNPFDVDFDGDSALITRAGDLVFSRINANSLASLGADLTIPWGALALDPDGQSSGGTLSGIAFIPGVGVFVANEAGQTANEMSIYGEFDSEAGGGFADFTHDDNDPILFAAIIPEPTSLSLLCIGSVMMLRRRRQQT